MAANSIGKRAGDSFLRELLYYAGWQLRVRDGDRVTIHAARDGVEIDVAAATLPEAMGTVFARAMRSGAASRLVEE